MNENQDFFAYHQMVFKKRLGRDCIFSDDSVFRIYIILKSEFLNYC